MKNSRYEVFVLDSLKYEKLEYSNPFYRGGLMAEANELISKIISNINKKRDEIITNRLDELKELGLIKFDNYKDMKLFNIKPAMGNIEIIYTHDLKKEMLKVVTFVNTGINYAHMSLENSISYEFKYY